MFRQSYKDTFFSAIDKKYVSLQIGSIASTLLENYHNLRINMESPIVTLTTDWGYHDFFAGMVKGVLYSSIPNVRVVDITHGVERFQLGSAVHVVRNACMGFPAGTIHIIDVTAPKNDDNPYIVVKHDGQYYICMDNGLPRALFGDEAVEAVVIDVGDYREKSFRTFAAYDIYCKAAVMLAQGAEMTDIGTPVEEFCPYTPSRPVVLDGKLKTYVSYIDDYGNATLNITYDEFEQIRAHRKFELWVREVKLTEVVRSYSHSRDAGNRKNAILLTVSASGYLQVAMRQYSTEQYFGAGLELQESVIVRFGEVVPEEAVEQPQT